MIRKYVTPIITAAGYGQIPVNSGISKLLAEIREAEPMIEVLMNAVYGAGMHEAVVVLNPLFASQIMPFLPSDATVVIQERRLGTAPAVLQALEYVNTEHVMVLFGDMALWRSSTLKEFAKHHLDSGKNMSMMSICAEKWDEHSTRRYGRIAKDAAGNILGIFEPEDPLPEAAVIRDVNPSMFIFRREMLAQAIQSITHVTSKREKTINSALYHFMENGGVSEFRLQDPEEALGINDEEQLRNAQKVYRIRTLSNE
ncbi:TPA: hypothetical protein DD449_00340 [Candidatus Berkelbacteria bacterium]|uniref:UDP-N-acetylglucosamine pyrophosphorylase n=1 Tax=Berkelbacteria bacterium GW2011_GWE1_39_12 TaxID=1618337 RepID=A0A0G4B5F8_9BACT|nr:MAG: UDP-N-acetylglucosamine pyrophosphorylase [Berkelbacteria bacterium GW2011_GWE1_39_12]HBO60122.1 hypothetical protein [Candidatus Berkelbacteria bacterium]